MQREVIKWVQSLDLSAPIQNPKRDLATGHLAAEIVARYTGTKYLDLSRLPTGVASATKCDVWFQVYRALQQVGCTNVTQPLIDAVLRREPNAALTVLEYLYEHFTSHALSMRGLDAVGTGKNAYVQPQNAASTAKLLKATSAMSKSRLDSGIDEETSTDKMTLPSSSATAVPSNGAFGHGAAADVLASAQDTMAGEADALANHPHHISTRDLQHRLALIDNDELAGGANALRAYPRYARPTASTLVHAATGSRKDVVLDRPKYAPDEILQRRQNQCILQQHAVVQKMQEERDGAKEKAPSHTRNDTLTETTTSSPVSLPPEKVVRVQSGKSAPATVPLVTLYRGRFYRQPDPPAATRGAKGSSGPRDGKKGKQGELSPMSRQGASASSKDHLTLNEDSLERERTSASGDTSPTTGISGGIGGSSGAGGSRIMPKIRVAVQTASIQAALTQRSSSAEIKARAATLSREHFAKHNFSLRSALGEILSDVLTAHKQLQKLFDCCVEDGSGEVLDNVLGHLLAHREEFPPLCIEACWQALAQHVDGIVAILQKKPEEYAYLIESLSFAFTREAAQVPLLHISQGVALSCEMDSAYKDGESVGATAHGSQVESVVATRRRSTVALSVPVAGSGYSAASGNSSTSKWRRKSLSEALLMTTPHATSVGIGSDETPIAISPAVSRSRAIIDTSDGLPLACAFRFLYQIARQLDTETAAHLLERYVLRCTKPFLLRRGTVAVREAIARVVSASFAPVPRTGIAGLGDTDIDVEAEKAFVQFLSDTLARALLGSTPTVPTDNGNAAPGPSSDPLMHSMSVCDASTTPSLHLHLQRTYWLLVFHAIAEYPCTTHYGSALPHGVDGPLATCLRRGAMTCLSSTDVDLRSVGVGLLIEYAERWLPRDVVLKGSAEEDSVAGVLDLFSRVIPSLDAVVVEPSIPWWRTQAANTWECRLMVVRLCVILLAHSFFQGAVTKKSSVGGSEDTWTSAAPNQRSFVDAAAAECLLTFDKAPSWQLQLALAMAAKAVDKSSTPKLTDAWCQLLFRIPPSSLLELLLPRDGDTVRLRLLHPLRPVPPFRESSDGLECRVVQRNSPSHQPLMAPLPNESTAFMSNNCFLGSAPPESWTLTPAMDGGDYACESGNNVTTRAAVHFVWGRVMSVYAVSPLNQVWNVEGIVDAVLPPLTDSNVPDATESFSAASLVQSVLPLLVMVAALLSPPGTTMEVAAPRTVTSKSRLPSIRSADEELEMVKRQSRSFWREALRRAWPLLRACGVSQSSAINLAHPEPEEDESHLDFDGEEAVVAPSEPRLTAESLGLSLEDLNTVVLAIFFRAADNGIVVAETEAAAGDNAKLCVSAIQWAEMMISETSTSVLSP